MFKISWIYIYNMEEDSFLLVSEEKLDYTLPQHCKILDIGRYTQIDIKMSFLGLRTTFNIFHSIISVF